MSSSKLSNLSWAELRDRVHRIGRRWSSEELPTGTATTAEEQLSVVQVDLEGEVERRAEQPDVEEVLAIEPPATKELPNVTNKQQQLPTASVTTTATSLPTLFAAVEQSSKDADGTFAVVSEEEGDPASSILVPDSEKTNALEEETQTEGLERRPTPRHVASWRSRKKPKTDEEESGAATSAIPTTPNDMGGSPMSPPATVKEVYSSMEAGMETKMASPGNDSKDSSANEVDEDGFLPLPSEGELQSSLEKKPLEDEPSSENEMDSGLAFRGLVFSLPPREDSKKVGGALGDKNSKTRPLSGWHSCRLVSCSPSGMRSEMVLPAKDGEEGDATRNKKKEEVMELVTAAWPWKRTELRVLLETRRSTASSVRAMNEEETKVGADLVRDSPKDTVATRRDSSPATHGEIVPLQSTPAQAWVLTTEKIPLPEKKEKGLSMPEMESKGQKAAADSGWLPPRWQDRAQPTRAKRWEASGFPSSETLTRRSLGWVGLSMGRSGWATPPDEIGCSLVIFGPRSGKKQAEGLSAGRSLVFSGPRRIGGVGQGIQRKQ
ncbi:unnamed protein product [Linum trigynum]|uniref:Uncharacterized protein n=1 Tax=Linum trigynum TaxID=586398 RepID=A0AAV2F269_9ROSI